MSWVAPADVSTLSELPAGTVEAANRYVADGIKGLHARAGGRNGLLMGYHLAQLDIHLESLRTGDADIMIDHSPPAARHPPLGLDVDRAAVPVRASV